MVVCQYHDTSDKLRNAPAVPVFTTIALQKPLQVICRDGPRLERHYLIQLTEASQAWFDLSQTFGDPSQIPAFKNKLFLKDVQ